MRDTNNISDMDEVEFWEGFSDCSDYLGVMPPSKDFKRKDIIKDYDTEWKQYLSEHPDLMIQKKE